MAFNSFTSSTKIESAKMNENFSNIADGTEVANIAWSPWTPTILKNDNVTELTPTGLVARYIQIGKIVIGSISVSNLASPTGPRFYFTLPVTAKSYGINYYIGGGSTVVDAAYSIGKIESLNSDLTKATIYLLATGNWGTANLFTMNFCYEAA